MSRACQQLGGLLKQKKALKSIKKYPQPYSLVWQHQGKKFQREDLLLDKHRHRIGPKFLNNSETQNFFLDCCFLLCTVLKQFSAVQAETIAAGLSDCQHGENATIAQATVRSIFWRLLISDISVLFTSHC